MNNKIDSGKSLENVKKFSKKTAESLKSTMKSVQQRASTLSDKVKVNMYQQRIKKYNPLFPEKFKDVGFHIPNIIMIVDDAVRKDIDVCKGAIGWIGDENGVEVLYLYDEEIEFSGIQFIPVPRCDAIYYVDNFDRSRFINIDCIFGRAHEERLAELKHIAYCLGAISCTIEITEKNIEGQTSQKSISSASKYKGINSSTSSEELTKQNSIMKRHGSIVAEFQGSTTPIRPELKWFANDDNIKRLIEMRLDNKNSNNIKSETVELEGSSSATMSRKTACTIDATAKNIGIKNSLEMESNAMRENLSVLRFSVVFP